VAIHELVITDVTCYGSLYCVAGWDLNNGGMIRPEPPTANALAEASRFWDAEDAGPGRFFAVGNVVRFDASAAPADFPYPHATEDRIFVPGPNTAFLRHCTHSQIARAAAAGISPSLAKAFGGALRRAYSGKAHVAAGARTGSLDAIEIAPAQLSFYEDNPSPGKRRLRARIQEGGMVYDLSVPADAARSSFLAGGIAALNEDVRASKRIHVRIGLCRPFQAMPDHCYAQVNGLYFLP